MLKNSSFRNGLHMNKHRYLSIYFITAGNSKNNCLDTFICVNVAVIKFFVFHYLKKKDWTEFQHVVNSVV